MAATTAETRGWMADQWVRVCHDARARTGGDLGRVEARLGGSVVGPDAGAEDREGAEREALALGRGLFGRLFAGGAEAAAAGPAWVRAAIGALRGPELEALAAQCRGDGDMAALAGGCLLAAVEEQIPELLERLQEDGIDPMGDPDEAVDGDGNPIDGDIIADALAAAGEGLGEAIAAAASSAATAVGEARVALNGVLPGLGSTPPAFGAEDPARLQLVERLRADERLRRVMRLAGRIHRIADRVRHQRTDEVRSEVADLEQGGDIAQVLASQLVGLVEPDLEMLTLAGLADRSLLQYRMHGQEPLGRGPIAVLLDVSGSMADAGGDGLDRVGWATAIGIACVHAGVEQRRDVAIATFQHAVVGSWRIAAGDRVAAQAAVLALAGIRADGGTSFDGPIGWALDAGAERDRADLVLVTDGEARVSPLVVDRLQAARGRGLRLWGVLVGDEAEASSLDEVADGVVRLTGNGDDAERLGALGAT